MFRTVSLLGLAVLTVAAVALTKKSPKKPVENCGPDSATDNRIRNHVRATDRGPAAGAAVLHRVFAQLSGER